MRPDGLVIADGDAATAEVREYEATRRGLVRRGLLLGGLAVAASSVPTLLKVSRAFARTGDDDARILEGAIALEQTAVFAYTAAAESGKLQPPVRKVALQFRDQEQQHADRLIAALKNLGGTPPPKPTSRAQVKGLAQAAAGGQRAILEFAIALEEMAVAAYHQAQQKLTDAKLVQTGASIMGAEGQHLVVLRQALRRNPVPNAFETGRPTAP